MARRPAAGRGGAGRPPRRTGDQRDGARSGGRAPAERPAAQRPPLDLGPPIPDEITGSELDSEVRRELLTLSKAHSELVARHLVMTGELLGVDPELAYAHAQAARRFGSRLAVVREASGLAAYGAGKYADALADLRAYRRMSGRLDHLPMEADCERGLGRPDRALVVASSPEARRLDVATAAELRMVVSGARRDLGQPEAAVTALQTPELRRRVDEGWWARLAYAYADALLEVGRRDEAMTWFGRAADADREGDTDAAERLAELEGFRFSQIEESDEALDDDDVSGQGE